MGFPNPFPAIGRFFKRAFNWVIHNEDLKGFLKSSFDSVVLATVKELESQDLANDVKHGIAFRVIEEAAIKAGYALGKNTIDWLIKTALLNLRGLIGPE